MKNFFNRLTTKLLLQTSKERNPQYFKQTKKVKEHNLNMAMLKRKRKAAKRLSNNHV